MEHLADEGFDDAWDDIDVDEDDDAICEKPVKRKDSIENSSQKIISESEKTDESDGDYYRDSDDTTSRDRHK